MHPLVYYSILEFERDETLRTVEIERQRRERQERQQLERHGRRIGHGRVSPARRAVLARVVAALRGRSTAPARVAAPSGRSAGAAAAIGCRA